MGNYTKMVLLYDKQYWREKGFSGETLSDCADSPILMGFDDSRAKDNGEVQPGFVVFLSAGGDR